MVKEKKRRAEIITGFSITIEQEQRQRIFQSLFKQSTSYVQGMY
jgi:hypothetical protein